MLRLATAERFPYQIEQELLDRGDARSEQAAQPRTRHAQQYDVNSDAGPFQI